MPKGFSTLELLVAMTVLALLLAISVPKMGRLRDRLAVTHAANEAATFIQKGRLEAVVKSRNIRLLFGSDRFTAYLVTGVPGQSDSLLFAWPGPQRLGVTFSVSRDQIQFQPTGIGYGAANTKLVFRRGQAGDSLSTSILGRARRR